MDSPTIFLPSRKSWKKAVESSLSSDDSMALIRVVSYVHRVMPYDDDCSRFNGSAGSHAPAESSSFSCFAGVGSGHRGELVECVEERAYLGGRC
mgnify:CR=1 FL=1